MSGIVVFLPTFELLQIADGICRDCSKVVMCMKLLNENIEAEVDILIGVQDLINQLQHMNIPMLPIASTEESIRIALNQAETLCYANELKRRNEAQVNSLLNSMFNGLIEIDRGGYVVLMNRVMEGILNKGQEEVLGKNIKEVVKDINMDLVHQVLNSPQESFSSFLNVNGRATVVILSPIVMEDKITGAYLSLKKIKKSDEINEGDQDIERRSGFAASRTFDDISYM
ncbi:PAS domain-containing protein [Lacrimispora sp.]|uniref:PAS domain-containing protein n=1 Tax=Lacrimispora sp. TaxID=2719234 RepID=UPI0028A2A4FC|nr:PAS domain-containing protein [Lacrimispora sp.]